MRNGMAQGCGILRRSGALLIRTIDRLYFRRRQLSEMDQDGPIDSDGSLRPVNTGTTSAITHSGQMQRNALRGTGAVCIAGRPVASRDATTRPPCLSPRDYDASIFIFCSANSASVRIPAPSTRQAAPASIRRRPRQAARMQRSPDSMHACTRELRLSPCS